MNTDLLLLNICKNISLNNEENARILRFLEEEKVTRNSFILREGEICDYIYFVNSGILRAYCINPDGKEATVMFAMKDWWITDMYCFLNGLPAMVNIQAVEACSTLKLSKVHLDTLFTELPKFNTFFRILMQNAYCREQLRTIQNLTLPAKDRYEQFTKKYPQIAKKVTLKQTASYLGITPEFLSVIRGKRD
ncbi:Crp/Fnr family transcriptional regulator [Cyclobacterium plantarum]|uniref:Crp/Fnr family transcriptional regulator n=1 Tax=Cyclobacterium plantarum TaxID=2716263 RepID=A0ABX0HHW8_9BACT|nr:Crp/Fnr family transcriptional regulator [Cyclobacterium plantarum]NHE59645.1 Crp/Fnr family transcriptional regulator [Cyclobacterium plantarum]